MKIPDLKSDSLIDVNAGGKGWQRSWRAVDHIVSGSFLQAPNQPAEIRLNDGLCPHKLGKCLLLRDGLQCPGALDGLNSASIIPLMLSVSFAWSRAKLCGMHQLARLLSLTFANFDVAKRRQRHPSAAPV